MKELSTKQVRAVAGGFWGVVVAVAAGAIATVIRHRIDKDTAKREGMDPNSRESIGF